MNALAETVGTGSERGEQIEMFEQPPFNPIFPSPASETGQVLTRLLRGESFSQSDLLHESYGQGSWRLAARIKELRDLGWPVMSIPTGHDKVVRYGLPRWVLSQLAVVCHG